MNLLTIKEVLVAIQKQKPNSDQEYCIALHDFVREHVHFGFTIGFESVTPEQTLALGHGHCNAQADLLCALMRNAGFNAYLRFISIDKNILRHAVPRLVLLSLPSRLFHAVTQVKLGNTLLYTDSYIFQRTLFLQQRQRLEIAGIKRGYGLAADARNEWDGLSNAFSQTELSDLQTNNPRFATLKEAIIERAGNNKLIGIHFNKWLSFIPASLHIASESYLNKRLQPDKKITC